MDNISRPQQQDPGGGQLGREHEGVGEQNRVNSNSGKTSLSGPDYKSFLRLEESWASTDSINSLSSSLGKLSVSMKHCKDHSDVTVEKGDGSSDLDKRDDGVMSPTKCLSLPERDSRLFHQTLSKQEDRNIEFLKEIWKSTESSADTNKHEAEIAGNLSWKFTEETEIPRKEKESNTESRDTSEYKGNSELFADCSLDTDKQCQQLHNESIDFPVGRGYDNNVSHSTSEKYPTDEYFSNSLGNEKEVVVIYDDDDDDDDDDEDDDNDDNNVINNDLAGTDYQPRYVGISFMFPSYSGMYHIQATFSSASTKYVNGRKVQEIDNNETHEKEFEQKEIIRNDTNLTSQPVRSKENFNVFNRKSDSFTSTDEHAGGVHTFDLRIATQSKKREESNIEAKDTLYNLDTPGITKDPNDQSHHSDPKSSPLNPGGQNSNLWNITNKTTVPKRADEITMTTNDSNAALKESDQSEVLNYPTGIRHSISRSYSSSIEDFPEYGEMESYPTMSPPCGHNHSWDVCPNCQTRRMCKNCHAHDQCPVHGRNSEENSNAHSVHCSGHSHSHTSGDLSRATEMLEVLAESVNREIQDVVPDGNCMFRAVVDQLQMQGETNWTAAILRKKAIQHLRKNPYQEDGTHLEMFLSTETWDKYLTRMEMDAEWGDQIILRGISEVTKRSICIISAMGDRHNQTTIAPSKSEESPGEDIYLGHLDHQHYVSLRAKNWQDTWYKSAKEVSLKRKEKKTDKEGQDSLPMILQYDPKESRKSLQRPGNVLDVFSGVPLPHLSYILTNILPHNKLAFKMEIDKWTETWCERNKSDILVCGSFIEGLNTFMEDLSKNNQDYKCKRINPNQEKSSSKPNLIMFNEEFNVYHGEEEEKQVTDNKRWKLLASSENVHPGYLHLRVENPSGVTSNLLKVIDGKTYIAHLGKQSSQERHESDDRTSYSCIGVRCQSWPPDSVTSWLERERPSGWPGKILIQKALREKCLALPFSHPSSPNPTIEWRYSFTAVTKILCKEGLDEFQIYCFLVFKVLVDFFTGEKNILSTFFLKTIFLYALQEVPPSQWKVDTSGCILYLLDRLLEGLKEGRIPHFFIPANNIIDHLPGSVVADLYTKIEAIRLFPITSVIILSQSHGQVTLWVADSVISDIGKFWHHQDVMLSLWDVFIPTTKKLLLNYLNYLKYTDAATCLMEPIRRVDPYFNLLDLGNQLVNELGPLQTWWICLFLDHKYRTNILPQMFWYEKGTLLKDMLGKECDAGDFGEVKIPNNLLRCIPLSHSFPEPVRFLMQFCYKLYLDAWYKEAAHYFRCLIHLLKKEIGEYTEQRESAGRQTTLNVAQKRVYAASGLQQRDGSSYQKQVMSTNLYYQLYMSLYYLYYSYGMLYQQELFTEYVENLEQACHAVSTYDSYNFLGKVYRALGNRQKAREAEQNAYDCDYETTTHV